MIVLKTARELGIMKEACVISAQALKLVGSAVEPGVSTWELDQIAETVSYTHLTLPTNSLV